MATSTSEPADFFEEFIEGESAEAPSTAGTVDGRDQAAGRGRNRFRRRSVALAGLALGAILALTTIAFWDRMRSEPPTLRSSTELTETTERGTSRQTAAAVGAEAELVEAQTADQGDNDTDRAAPVEMVVEGERLVMDGVVDSEELRDSFFIAVSQLTTDGLAVENNLRVEPGGGTELEISLQVRDSVLFDVGSAEVSDEFAGLLDSLASLLALVPETDVRVAGHTDLTGSDEINDVLSEARATAIVDYLAAHGVPIARLRAVGYGSRRPIADNSTPDGRRANRRIEIEIMT